MQKRTEILLVEDNPGDVLLTREAFIESGFNHRLAVASDGEQALRFLRRESPFEDAPRPDVILLDLNLPRKDGRELLADIKADADLMFIPVIILTTSDAEHDVQQAYSLHANCYITKPLQVEAFLRKISSLEDFWLHVVRLPAR